MKKIIQAIVYRFRPSRITDKGIDLNVISLYGRYERFISWDEIEKNFCDAINEVENGKTL